MEEVLTGLYLASVSVRRVEDIVEALWGTNVSHGTISNLNKKVNTSKSGVPARFPVNIFMLTSTVFISNAAGGEIQNVSVLVVIRVNEDGYCEIIGVAEGMKEDICSWHSFFV